MAIDIGWTASAIGLGFAYAALPGAVNVEALRRGFAGGFRRSLLVHTGALIGAGFWAVVALTGASFLAKYDTITTLLGLAGAAFLIRLTIIAIRGIRANTNQVDAAPRTGADMTVGVVVGIANPAGIPFWTGLAGGVVASEDGSLDPRRAAVFVAGVLIGSFAWGCALSSLIAWGRQYLSTSFFRGVNAVCAVAFGYFALRMLWTTLPRLVP